VLPRIVPDEHAERLPRRGHQRRRRRRRRHGLVREGWWWNGM
jgi:hypothetical protein